MNCGVIVRWDDEGFLMIVMSSGVFREGPRGPGPPLSLEIFKGKLKTAWGTKLFSKDFWVGPPLSSNPKYATGVDESH